MICLYFKSPLFWHYFWNFGLPCLVLSSFFSAEWFGTEFREFASIFVPRNGIPSPFLFRWSVRKGIPRDCFYFLFNGTEFRVLFSSAEGFGTEFRDFLFRGTAGIPSEITLCSVYSVFRGIIFLSEIPNPRKETRPEQEKIRGFMIHAANSVHIAIDAGNFDASLRHCLHRIP